MNTNLIKRYENIINFKINPNKHIFGLNDVDGDLFNQLENQKIELIADYIDAISDWAEDKHDLYLY